MTDFLRLSFILGQLSVWFFFKAASDRYTLDVWRILIVRPA